jgi:hypothetical protein
MQPDPDILQQLLDLLVSLYDETDGFADNPGDAQLWYNRGYANGMVRGLRELGQGERVAERIHADGDDVIAGQEAMAWGKAYRHGADTGYRETLDVLPQGGG